MALWQYLVYFILAQNIIAEELFAEETSRHGGEKRPNIILFVADDLGYGDLSFSGHPTSQTPNLDHLARNGKFFTSFYVTNPICSPSRASLLTGRYSSRSGVYPSVFTPDSYLGLPTNETTIANVLKTAGYATQMVGKWHLGVGFNGEFLPTNFGFDDYLGIPYSHDMCPCDTCFPNNGSCLTQCWNWPVSCPLYSHTKIKQQPAILSKLTKQFLLKSQEFMIKAHKESSPFFLYYAFPHIHHAQYASKKFHGTSIRGPVGDSLSELDWSIANIMHTLHNLNIVDDTLIIFTSDNGPSLTWQQLGGSAGLLRCGKGTTMEGGVRVPAITYWPNKIHPGKSNVLLSSLDLLPTIAQLVNVSISHLTVDGIDFSNLLTSKTTKGVREFFAIYPQSPTQALGPFAVIYRNFKAHFYTKGSSLSDDNNFDEMCRSSHQLTTHEPPLLFNLNEDPGERHDLSKDKSYSEIINVISKWRIHHMENMEWILPRTENTSEKAQPCCSGDTNCQPFPSCCDCQFNPK